MEDRDNIKKQIEFIKNKYNELRYNCLCDKLIKKYLICNC